MRRTIAMVASLVLFLAGLFVVFNSLSLGGEAANAYLRAQGGMDSAQFMITLEASIAMYRWIGGILSIIAGLGFVKAFEKLL